MRKHARRVSVGVRKMSELTSRAELKNSLPAQNMRAAHSHINVLLLSLLLLTLTLVPWRSPETSEVHLKQVLLQIPPSGSLWHSHSSVDCVHVYLIWALCAAALSSRGALETYLQLYLRIPKLSRCAEEGKRPRVFLFLSFFFFFCSCCCCAERVRSSSSSSGSPALYCGC